MGVSTTDKKKKKPNLDAKKRGLHNRVTTTNFQQVDIDKLDEADEDLRFHRSSHFEDLLLDDMRKEGAFIPVIVRPKNGGRFQIIDGTSRVRDARLLGMRTVQCQIIECDDTTAIIIGLKANIYRRRQDPVGLARAFKTLHDRYKMKYRDIAKRFNYTKGWVSKLVALCDLPLEYQQAVSRGDLTIEKGYAIVVGERDVLRHIDERRQVACEVCGHKFDALEVTSKRICFECERGYHSYRLQYLKRYEEDMKRAEARLKAGQKELFE